MKHQFKWLLIIITLCGIAPINADLTDLQTQLDALGYKATVKMVNNNPVAQGGQKSFKPFETDYLTTLNTIKIENPTVTFEKNGANYNAVIIGQYTLFDFGSTENKYFSPIKLTGKLKLHEMSGGGKAKILEVDMPAKWKLSDSMPKLKKTIFDDISINNVHLIISSDNYIDTDNNIAISSGVNLIADLHASSGPLKPFIDFLGISSSTKLQVVGHIPDNPFSSSFRIQLSKSFSFKTPIISVGQVGLEINGTSVPGIDGAFSIIPTISLVGNITIKPSPIDDPLQFTMRMTFVIPKPDVGASISSKSLKMGEPSFILAATMSGKWKHPFGIPGIDIGSDHSECIKNNVDTCSDVPKGIAVQAQITPTVFAETGLPDNLGVTGALALGRRHVAMAVQLPLSPPTGGVAAVKSAIGAVIYGELDEFTLNDYITLIPQMMGFTIPGLDKIPLDKVGIKQVKVYIVPTPTSIGEISFHEGLTLRGDIFIAPFESIGIPSVETYGLINLSKSGLEANAFCSNLNLGPLHISKSSQETANDTKQRNAVLDKFKEEQANMPTPIDDKQFRNGPMMHLALSKDKQELLISGNLSVASLFEEDTYISINSSGLTFDLKTSYGKAMYHGKGLLDAHMHADAKFEKPINFHVIADFESNLKLFITEQVKNGLEGAKNEITKGLSQAKHKVSERLSGAEGAIGGARGTVSSGINTAKNKAQRDLQSAQEAVNSIQNDINNLTDSIKRHEKGCFG